MQIERINNQPSFNARFKILPLSKGKRIRHGQERELNKIAKGIGAGKDEIILEIGPIIEDNISSGQSLRHYLISGAYRINEKMGLYKIATIAKQGQALKQPFDLLKEALEELKTIAEKTKKLSNI